MGNIPMNIPMAWDSIHTSAGSLIEQFHRALNCHTECPRNDAGTFAPLAPVVVVGGSEAPVAAVYLAEKPAADRA